MASFNFPEYWNPNSARDLAKILEETAMGFDEVLHKVVRSKMDLKEIYVEVRAKPRFIQGLMTKLPPREFIVPKIGKSYSSYYDIRNSPNARNISDSDISYAVYDASLKVVTDFLDKEAVSILPENLRYKRPLVEGQ